MLRDLVNPIFLACLSIAGCSPQQSAKVDTSINSLLVSAPGQLFCKVQLAGGGDITVAIIQGAVSFSPASPAGPLVVMATNATKEYVNNKCNDAAKIVPNAVSATPTPPPSPATTVPAVTVPSV